MAGAVVAGRKHRRPRLLDLFCCQGGSSHGFAQAGFEVVGVDRTDQPRYPYEFHRADALEFLAEHAHEFDAVAASPPCQAFTKAQVIRGREHPDLITPTRELLIRLGIPAVIENVEGAPLRDPTMLCGAMFGIRTYRHRLFETLNGFHFTAPPHPEHTVPLTKMGRRPEPGTMMFIVGNFIGVDEAREVMGMPWASRNGLREAIPPVYTLHIGMQLLGHLLTQPRQRQLELFAV